MSARIVPLYGSSQYEGKEMTSQDERTHQFALECLMAAMTEAGYYAAERGIVPTLEDFLKLADVIRERFTEGWGGNTARENARKLLAEARQFGVEAVDLVWPKQKLN